jgi:hypothetical protein
MNRPQTKHGDELLARAVMRAVLGVPVERHDDQTRRGMYDLAVSYPDGRRAAAEVVSTRDRRALELSAAAGKLGYVRRPELTRKWIVLVDPGARLKQLARVVPAHLAQLEQDGIHRLRRTFRDPWPAGLRTLGVVSCVSMPPTRKHPPGFYLNPYPTAAWSPPGDEVVRACDEFLAVTPDIAAKLLASGLTERHAVVVVTVDWLGPLISIEDGAMPTAAPTLPGGVDCLWMVTLRTPPIRAIFWLGDGVWRDIVLTQHQLDALDEKSNQAA